MRAAFLALSLLGSLLTVAGCSCGESGGRPRRDSGPAGDRDGGGTPGGETGAECTDGIDNDMDAVLDCDETTCVTYPACGRDAGPIDASFFECEGVSVTAEEGYAPVDIVWIIDNSGSMGEETELVQTNINDFVATISASGIDYHVIVITEPTAHGLSVPEPLGTDPMRFRLVSYDVQSNDALSDLIASYSMWSDFLRPDSVLHFIHLTDDESDMGAGEFMTQMAATLGGRMWTSHSICSLPADERCVFSVFGSCIDYEGCRGVHGDAPATGNEYVEVSSRTGGQTISVCSSDWSLVFDRLLSSIAVPIPLPCEYAIPEPPEGMMFDPMLVNVDYTPSGGARQRIPAARSVDECPSGSDGWYYDDPSAPTQILLCPGTCSIVAADTSGMVNIALGCATIFG